MTGSMIPAPTFCACPPLTTGAGTPIPRTESWEHLANCPGRFPLDVAERVALDRSQRGLPRTDARDVLISLAIGAGYSFTQIAEQLRSGRGDERLDLPGGDHRLALNEPLAGPGSETLLERAMRDA